MFCLFEKFHIIVVVCVLSGSFVFFFFLCFFRCLMCVVFSVVVGCHFFMFFMFFKFHMIWGGR